MGAHADQEEDAREEYRHADVLSDVSPASAPSANASSASSSVPRTLETGLLVLRRVGRPGQRIRIRFEIGCAPRVERAANPCTQRRSRRPPSTPRCRRRRLRTRSFKRRGVEVPLLHRFELGSARLGSCGGGRSQADRRLRAPLRGRVPGPGDGQRHQREEQSLGDRDEPVMTRRVRRVLGVLATSFLTSPADRPSGTRPPPLRHARPA